MKLSKIAGALASRTKFLRPRLRSPYPTSFPIPSSAQKELSFTWPEQYDWQDAGGWVGGIRDSLARIAPVRRERIPQGHRCVAFTMGRRGKQSLVTIDYNDIADTLDERLLAESAVYFKMHYRRDGYGDKPVVPAGFVNGHTQIARLLRKVRHIRDHIPPRYEVYGRFGLTFQREIRSRAIELLSSDPRFAFEGGAKKVRYPEFLAECASSSVCIDLPSNSDFCFRFVDYLAIGCTVVAWPHRTVMHVPLEEGRHVRYCREDLADIGEICHTLLENKQEAHRMGLEAREYYDRYLHPDQLAAYYVTTTLEHEA